MGYLNTLKKLIKLPFAILWFPVFIIILFFITNWDVEYDRALFRETIKTFLW